MDANDRLFDRYVIVDWSAAAVRSRGADSIWVHSLGVDDDRHDVIENPSTRTQARDRVRGLLVAAVEQRERVFVGFDFPYGYPRGFAAALGLAGAPWRAVWDYLSAQIVDGASNANNRFVVAAEINRRLGTHAFWACPPGQVCEHLSSRKDRARYFEAVGDAGLPEWRTTERALIAAGTRPQSVWKLYTAGSVGSQALVGIPVVASLRDDPGLAPCSVVWPFETMDSPTSRPALPPDHAAIVHAEIWPSIVNIVAATARPENAGKVKDQVQVEQLARHLRTLDTEGRLAELFRVPPDAGEEGWILGARLPN